MRRDLERLIAMLAELDVDLTLTTNGSLLPQKAQALADAGLRRITVSLDSLDDATFRAMNDVDFPVERVLEGIDAARAAGLPVKVNAVVKRGVERRPDRPDGRASSASAGTRSASSSTWTSAHTNGWRLDDVVPAAEIVAHARRGVRRRAGRGRRTAARSRSAGATATARGEIGVIASVTQPFCGDCTRARLSAEGKLYTCLFAVRGHDLRALIRGGASDERARGGTARAIWKRRGDRYSELRSEPPPRPCQRSRCATSAASARSRGMATSAPRLESKAHVHHGRSRAASFAARVGGSRAPAWRSGSASPCSTSSRAGSPTATRAKAFAQRPRGRSISRRSSRTGSTS